MRIDIRQQIVEEIVFEAPAAAGLDGGLLASAAVERLRLLRRPVVVLASCRSGAAGADAARVPATLARAFLAAGARAVVATLWDVGDEAAAEMGLALDERLAGGRDAAGALREVQAGMASRRTLRDWAGFYVLTAEVRPSNAAGGRSGRGGGS